MTIAEILELKAGETVKRFGEPVIVRRTRIVLDSRETTDKENNPLTLDLSYVAFIHSGGEEKLRSIEHRPRYHPSRRWAIYFNASFFYGFGGTDYGAVYLAKALIDFGDLEGFCAWYTPPQP